MIKLKQLIDSQIFFYFAIFQAVRAELRDRYLKVLRHSVGKPCKVNLFESTTLHCDFGSADIHGAEFLVENLKTPTDSYPSALLRSTDIVAMQIDCSRTTDGSWRKSLLKILIGIWLLGKELKRNYLFKIFGPLFKNFAQFY